VAELDRFGLGSHEIALGYQPRSDMRRLDWGLTIHSHYLSLLGLYHRLGGLKGRCLFFHSSGDNNPEFKVSVRLTSSEASQD
jgi:hypothetical protein